MSKVYDPELSALDDIRCNLIDVENKIEDTNDILRAILDELKKLGAAPNPTITTKTIELFNKKLLD